MHVSLTPELEALVKQKVSTGRYNSSSEVVREALRLWEDKEKIREMRLEELRKEIQKGLDSGPSTPLDIEDIKKRGRERLEKKQQTRK